MPGLLSRLRSREHAPPRPRGEPMLRPGWVPLEVVGEGRRQEALWRIVGARPGERVRYETAAVLHPDPRNPVDPGAIAVWVEGEHVGYLPAQTAARYLAGLLELSAHNGNRPITVPATVVGGGPGRDFLGVFLDHNPGDFGVAAAHVPGGLRSGLTAALATDAADDSYDLSWLTRLPNDGAQAAAALEQLLRDERDPLDRHFMLAELERRLYHNRERAGALERFDAVCRQHDHELAEMRPILLAKFGAIPLVELYRQAAIRAMKAGQFTEAREWCERGIRFYGDDAARPEAVVDLQTRLARAQARLDRTSSRAPAPQEARRAPSIETLTCARCGLAFPRERQRGRKPLLCPDCRHQDRGEAVRP
jgi:hypothetical protein